MTTHGELVRVSGGHSQAFSPPQKQGLSSEVWGELTRKEETEPLEVPFMIVICG